MAKIKLDTLTKAYGPVEVLHHVAGDIDDGEFIVIVGPSGCGKSTLLRMVAGLETITSGEISIGGKVVNDLERQAPPEYVEAVVSEQEEKGSSGAAGGGKVGASGDELYDKAVQIVLRDRKVSTSYIQRRLQIGYNKAATLIERMEEEGLISAPNSKGRREILVGGDSAQD